MIHANWRFPTLLLLLAAFLFPNGGLPCQLSAGDISPAADKHIVILAGPITGHPRNTHEYEKSAFLIKHLLDRSDLQGIRTSVVLGGWPDDPQLLDSADTIVLISDGGDHQESNHPFYNGDRFQQLQRQMERGCGLVQFHWATFNPSRFHDQITEWVGGYFDYEKGNAPNRWYSAIKHYTEPIRLGEPEHPISRGVQPFRVLEEFYYRIRFRENDPRLKKIVLSKPTGEATEYAVGWAVQRADGGRGFGFTGGHYYMNWWEPNFRKLVLNAIVWTAGVEVPQAGVETKLAEPTRALIVTGHNHPAHDWRATTAALIQVVENDPRILVDVTEDPEFLGTDKLPQYDVVIMNYSSWDRGGLSQKARKGFVRFLKAGGGLSIIHFANGSWTDTLPNQDSDWPEYRTRIVRRIWDHGQGLSGHDAFGNFQVNRTDVEHPITAGLRDFSTQDELYYRQQGSEPIEPLVTARSRDTGKAEPLAWAYGYEEARVFQTVLGHADVSILMAGDLIRRGTAWAAGLENLSFDPPVERDRPYLWRSGSQWSPQVSLKKSQAGQPAPEPEPAKASLPQLVAGKFGQALNARDGGVLGAAHPDLQQPGLTVECWVKIDSREGFNIIAASETKSSLRHWELYTYAGTGYLSVYMPGIFGEIKSTTNICDSQWHYVAMTFGQDVVKLYVDGKLVKEQPINFRKHPATHEGFAIGSLVEKTLRCDGLIDEFRVSREIKTIEAIPSEPFAIEAATIGLWRFDELNEQKKVRDQSQRKNDVATVWQGVTGQQVNVPPSDRPEKITGHWGEDAIGFRWTEKDSEDNRWALTQHGRYLTSTIPLPGGFAEKGLAIKVGESDEATVCYDLKRLNLMAGWSGGFLKFSPARFGLIQHLQPAGEMLFHNRSGLGWNSDELTFHGLYPHGKRVLLDYSINSTRILESPWLEKKDQTLATIRELSFGPVARTIEVPIVSDAAAEGSYEQVVEGVRLIGLEVAGETIAVALVSDHPAATLVRKQNQIWLRLATADQAGRAQVLIWRGRKDGLTPFAQLASAAVLSDPARFQRPGPQLWPETIKTEGVIGEQTGWGYALDTIRLPFKNPYGALFFVTGHDWLDNGDMVVSTVHGDVWLARNIDQQLDNVVWHRFATGLYQPLGIRVVENQIYVLCRDQIVRLHDRDGNDEADYHECFHADITTSTGTHDYVCCLETDQAGNFYYIHANDGVVRVSPDGSRSEIVATGFRNPNGLGVRSDGLITAAPQEGNWTPASAVCEVLEGRHYGYRGPGEKTADSPLGYEKPMVFFPRLVDNSSGGQFWSETDRWGLLGNQLFHLSYGKCTTHLILRDEIPPANPDQMSRTQGAIVPLPFEFESGVCRGRVSPHDGQVYLSGLKGWTTAAVRDGSLQRLRFLGGEAAQQTFVPISYRVFANGVELGFTQPIDPASIQAKSFSVEAWNYRYSENYGSPEFKITNPNQQGRDRWTVKSAKLTDGNRKLFLEIPQLVPADQVAIRLQVRSDHASYDDTIYATIKQKRNESVTPGAPFDPALAQFESRLQPGVWLPDAAWQASRLDYFAKTPQPGSGSQDQESDSRDSAVSSSVAQVAWLQLEAPLTVLRVQTGPQTTGTCRITALNASVSTSTPQEFQLAANAQLEIPVAAPAGYCRLEIQLQSQGEAIQSQWSWKSQTFGWEPVPNGALFVEKNWLQQAGLEVAAEGLPSTSQLIVERGCVRCHQLPVTTALPSSRLQRTAPDLLDLGSRRSRAFVYKKILEPHFEGHDAEMPRLLDAARARDLERAADLVAYLITGPAKGQPSSAQSAPARTEKMVATGEELFEQLGCIGCHHLPIEGEQDRYDRLSLKFTADKFTASGLRQFLIDPQRHAPFRKMGNFALSDQEAEALAQFIEEYSPNRIANSIDKQLAAGDPERGARWFAELNCANCHQARANQPEASRWVKWEAVDQGCLGDTPSESAPDLGLSSDQKQQLARQLATWQNQPPNRLQRWPIERDYPVWQQAAVTMQQLRCATCHAGAHGEPVLPEIVLDEGVLGLNPERLPNLDQAGFKLHTAWLERLFAGEPTTRVRPWLKARMPSFAGHGELLAHGLTAQAGYDPRQAAPVFRAEQDLVETGHLLIQPSQGLDCRQCHGVGDQPPSGDDKTQIVLGVNFSQVTSRLRREYYDRWMRDPLRIDPQTKMPRYSTDGRTTRIREIADGNADRQFEAIWHYLWALRPEDAPAQSAPRQ